MVNWCSSSFPCRVDPSEAQEDDPSLLSAVQKKGIKSRIPWPMAPVICVFIAYKSPTKPLWILWFLGGRIHPVNPPSTGNGIFDLDCQVATAAPFEHHPEIVGESLPTSIFFGWWQPIPNFMALFDISWELWQALRIQHDTTDLY